MLPLREDDVVPVHPLRAVDDDVEPGAGAHRVGDLAGGDADEDCHHPPDSGRLIQPPREDGPVTHVKVHPLVCPEVVAFSDLLRHEANKGIVEVNPLIERWKVAPYLLYAYHAPYLWAPLFDTGATNPKRVCGRPISHVE